MAYYGISQPADTEATPGFLGLGAKAAQSNFSPTQQKTNFQSDAQGQQLGGEEERKQAFAAALQQQQGSMQNDPFKAQQQAQIAQLQAQANGTGPSVAGAFAQQQQQANLAGANAQAASARGGNVGLAQRNAMNAAAGANQGVAGQAAQMKMQEQLSAQQQLGGVLSGARGQDIQQQQQANQLGLGQGALGLQANQANLQSGMQQQMQNQGINAQMAQANLQAGMEHQRLGQQASQFNVGQQNAFNQQQIEGQQKMFGSAVNAVGTGLMMASEGGHIQGHAKVNGDSETNDTVPAMLSPGEIVIPRTKAKDPDKAKAFIDHLMKGKGKKKDAGEESYGKVLEANRKLSARVDALEKHLGGKV